MSIHAGAARALESGYTVLSHYRVDVRGPDSQPGSQARLSAVVQALEGAKIGANVALASNGDVHIVTHDTVRALNAAAKALGALVTRDDRPNGRSNPVVRDGAHYVSASTCLFGGVLLTEPVKTAGGPGRKA